MTLLHKLGLYVAFAFALFAAGLTTGFLIKKERVKTEIVEKIVEVRVQDAKEIERVAQADEVIAKKQQDKAQLVSSIKKEVRKNVPANTRITPPLSVPLESGYLAAVPQGEGSPNESMATAPNYSNQSLFSNRDVWLLNSARAGTFDHRPEPSDAEGKAASPVTREEFIDNDLDIIGQYHELAETHNALVDEVERLQAEQRKRLGIE